MKTLGFMVALAASLSLSTASVRADDIATKTVQPSTHSSPLFSRIPNASTSDKTHLFKRASWWFNGVLVGNICQAPAGWCQVNISPVGSACYCYAWGAGTITN